jgi:hypothetical protein
MLPVVALVLPDPEHSAITRTVLVVGYLIATVSWWRAGLRTSRSTKLEPEILQSTRSQTVAVEIPTPDDSFARWWKLGALLLLFLMVSKTVDLRAQCEVLLRQFAKATGWWEQRPPVQFFLAIILPALAGLVFGWLVFARARQFTRSHPLAAVGWLLLYLYLACRQSLEWKPALHWLRSIGYFDWRLLLEAAGILLLSTAAFRTGKLPQTRADQPLLR